MFRAPRHPVTTLLVLAAFSAANTLSVLWHDHPHAHAGRHNGCHAHSAFGPSHHDDADHDAHGVALHGPGRPADGNALHDDDCLSCRFAGQRSLSAAFQATGHSSHLCLKLAVAAGDSPFVTLRRTAQSRAPPPSG